MTDKLIATDGTTSGLSAGAAISDTDYLELQQAVVSPASTVNSQFSAIKTWIKSWIVKGDVGLGNVSNTDTTTQANVAFTGLSAAAAAADADTFPTNQGAGNLKQTLGAVKTWIQSWLTKAMVGLGNVANSLQLVAANNLSDVANLDVTRTNLMVGFGGIRNRFYTFHDCLYTSGISPDWSTQINGTGAVISGIAVGSLNALGIFSLDLGTTIAGRAALYSSSSGVASNVLLGLGRARIQAKAAIHTLSNATDSYTTRVGFIDNSGSESTDGVFFRYTDGVNSGKWQAVCRSNNVETANDTGITPVADTWHLMTVDVNAAGTSAAFSIDGSVVQTITTNIPVGAGRELGYGMLAIKSAGTTATSGGYVDFMEVEYDFTTQR